MKKIIPLLVSLISFSAYSQNVKIIKGTEYSPRKAEGVFSNILDTDDNFFYVKRLSTAGAGFTQVIQKIDRRTFDIAYTMEYEYDESNRDLIQETEIQTSLVKDNFFVFTRKFNLKELVVYLLFRKFDAVTGKEIGTQQSALKIECTKQQAPYIKFYVEFSADKSKMLLGSNTSNEITVYETKGLNKIGVISLNFKDGATYSDFNIDNSGDLVYLAKEKGVLSLVQLPLNNRNPITTTLLEHAGETKASHLELKDDKIMICGLLLTDVLDVFCVCVDPKNNKVVMNERRKFTTEIMDKLKYEFNSKPGAENKYYSFEKIVMDKESFYLILSQSYSTVYYSGNSRPVTTPTQNELIITKFKSTGEYQWMKLIPKYNYDKTAGFNYVATNNELYLFYLQHPKDDLTQSIESLDYSKYGMTSGLGGCSFVCAKIDASGGVSRKSLFKNKGWCYKPITNLIDEKDNSLTIKMIEGKNERYDKLVIE